MMADDATVESVARAIQCAAGGSLLHDEVRQFARAAISAMPMTVEEFAEKAKEIAPEGEGTPDLKRKEG